jgi:dTDP-4-dehydrorhamnose reductase
MKKKIYIAGCGGMLGEAFYSQFKNDYEIKCTDKDVNERWLSFLDFRNFESYKSDVINFEPDYLFHLGAYTDLEFCEQNIDETYLTNTLAVENAVYLANNLNIPLLYISTAGIFDGKKELYDDWDLPNPLGVYARSKYMGERFVVENANRYLVCRAGWMMGAGPNKDKKFIQKIMMQLKQGNKELFIVDDKDGTPTYTHDFAKNVKLLLENEYWGLYNMVCEGQTSRLEVAQELLKLLNLERKVKLTAVSSDYFKDIYFAVRPPCERLRNRKLQIRNLNIMQHWQDALKEYIDTYYFDYLKASDGLHTIHHLTTINAE